MKDDFLWVEKYRPRKVSEVILPKILKSKFQEFVNSKNIPNMILSGPPGIGKTSVAKAMLDELGCDYITINGSLDGNIATLRNDILSFASSVSFSGGRKYVILDEADNLNATSTQPALRNFIESYSNNCGFILTCNHKEKIDKALHSRCPVIEFKIEKSDMLELASDFVTKVEDILKLEGITYQRNDMLNLIKKFFPDFRRCLGELQFCSATKTLDIKKKRTVSENEITELCDFLKKKAFTSIRSWVTENSDIDSSTLHRLIYDLSSKYFTPNGIAELVILISKYQYQETFVVDKEINTTAFLVEVMLNCEFK